MTEEQELKMQVLKSCGGNFQVAQAAFNWFMMGSARVAASEKDVPAAMPREMSDRARAAMRNAFDVYYLKGDFIDAIYRTLYAHLSPPSGR